MAELEVIELAGSMPDVVMIGTSDRPTPVFIPGTVTAAGDKIQWYSGDGPPPNFIPGARPGAMWIDESGGGLYQL